MAKDLTAIAVARAQPRDKSYKLAAGGGLLLLVQPTGAKYWRWKYRFAGKEKALALGVYPEVSLADARRGRDKARELHAQGIDPGVQRRVAKAARLVAAEDSLEAVAREWQKLKAAEWSITHATKVLGRLEKDVFPSLGHRPINGITMPECLVVLRAIEARGAIDTARRVRQHLSDVFVYGGVTNRCDANPAADLAGVLRVPVHASFPTLTDPRRIGDLMRAIESYSGTFSTRALLRVAPLVFVRPSELRLAEWTEMDLDHGMWLLPAARLKLRKQAKASASPHAVPLSRQAVAILRDLQLISGGGRYVFASAMRPGHPLSAETVNKALHTMGFKGELVGHGLRHMASTALNEQGWDEKVIERQLAHADGNKVRGIYNKAQYLPARRQMMQAWSDYLVQLREAQPARMATSARRGRSKDPA